MRNLRGEKEHLTAECVAHDADLLLQQVKTKLAATERHHHDTMCEWEKHATFVNKQT
jgi:hypothetical protein